MDMRSLKYKNEKEEKKQFFNFYIFKYLMNDRMSMYNMLHYVVFDLIIQIKRDIIVIVESELV